MKTKRTIIYGLFAVILALAFIACDLFNPLNGGNTDPKTLVIQGLPQSIYESITDPGNSEVGIFLNGTTPEQAMSRTNAVAGADMDNSDIIRSSSGAGTVRIDIPLYIPGGSIRWNGSGNYMIYAGLVCSGGTRYFRVGPVNFSSAVTTITYNSNWEIDPSGNSGTPGLAYELINGGTAYRVRKGSVTGGAVVIPATYNGLPVREIGSADDNGNSLAFYNTSITGITIPESVTTIGQLAFYSCASLTSITIPNSVTSIGYSAFIYCIGLTSITVAANNPYYAGEGGILYNKAKTTLIAYPSASGNVTTIPNSVTSIDNYAFLTNHNITAITIPASVTSIGSYAFDHCSNLTSFTFSAGSNIQSANFSINYLDENISTLKTAYLANGAGTYTRAAGGSTWTKQ